MRAGRCVVMEDAVGSVEEVALPTAEDASKLSAVRRLRVSVRTFTHLARRSSRARPALRLEPSAPFA